ncbi:MAG TPA: hypothetical protein VEQ60_08375 [Longimicrobium sp.]|nr:hypothetical protein [Longimicrobium sp.]
MTTRPDAATRHVVERCPRCGVEHDVRVQECEACHAPLRYWCRAHGRETGWLDDPACARCAQEAVRLRPAPSMRMPCPAPAMPSPVSLAPPVAADASVEVAPAAAKPLKRFSPAGHVVVMFLMILITTGAAALAGVVLAFVLVLAGRGILPDTAVQCAVGGAVVGALAGVLSCAHYLTTLRNPPPEA